MCSVFLPVKVLLTCGSAVVLRLRLVVDQVESTSAVASSNALLRGVYTEQI